jgi:hypothetical protein
MSDTDFHRRITHTTLECGNCGSYNHLANSQCHGCAEPLPELAEWDNPPDTDA